MYNNIDDVSTVKSSWFYNAKFIRNISSILFISAFIYSLTWLAVYIVRLPYFVINNFNIYTNGIDINLNIIQEQLSKNKYNFFSPSLNDIRFIFEDIPSIKNANIIRKYPNSVDVILEKQKPFARWGTQDNLYINSEGIVYIGSNYDELRTSITLYGQENDADLVLKQYYELQKIIKYKIISLTYSTERNWIIIISNPVNLNNNSQIIQLTLGKEDNNTLANKIKFWQNNWSKLKTKSEYANMNAFDLRYNGFTMKADNNLQNKTNNMQSNNSQKSEDSKSPEDIPHDDVLAPDDK